MIAFYADGLVAAATAGAGAAAGAAATASARERLGGGYEKAHGAGVNSGAANAFPQFFHSAEGIAILLNNEVLLVGFIEREADAGAAAAARGEIQTDSRFFLVGKKSVEFDTGIFSKNKHHSSPLCSYGEGKIHRPSGL